MRTAPAPKSTAGVRQITDITRQAIADLLTLERDYFWFGKGDELSFLGDLYDLKKLPSTDYRFSDADGDIWQHCVNNFDWDASWVFSDPRFDLLNGTDEQFLRFLARTVHPLVRRDDIAERMVSDLNKALAPDKYELVPETEISGRKVYTWRRLDGYHGDRPAALTVDRATLGDRDTLDRHLRRIEPNITADPEAAIGSCKELVESVFVQILNERGATHKRGDDLPTLYKAVSRALDLAGSSVDDDPDASTAVNGLLRSLGSSVQFLGELRNRVGTGHGRATASTADRRHARLALNTAVAITEFLFDVWETRHADQMD
ncbi:abortive infection family protein [Rhodococcus koreensis]|uniref:Abortive infection C-terminus n=1 Tax=Rhodococcus koreensis TaxID=99653 RepID=A0A1H5F2Z9_9NOCA|nr:abortive infection family protein [Rhodococcus koreensis]SED97654.1 Abortive infection C-terminus [Rhodococcus koreensis]